MPRRKDSIGYVLVHECPWWVSVLVAGLVYGLMRWVPPLIVTENVFFRLVLPNLPKLAPLAGLVFLGLGALSLWRQGLESWVARRRASRGDAPRPEGLPPATTPAMTSPPSCPACGSPMVKRQARRGRNAGGSFWGCSRYPDCRGTRGM